MRVNQEIGAHYQPPTTLLNIVVKVYKKNKKKYIKYCYNVTREHRFSSKKKEGSFLFWLYGNDKHHCLIIFNCPLSREFRLKMFSFKHISLFLHFIFVPSPSVFCLRGWICCTPPTLSLPLFFLQISLCT